MGSEWGHPNSLALNPTPLLMALHVHMIYKEFDGVMSTVTDTQE